MCVLVWVCVHACVCMCVYMCVHMYVCVCLQCDVCECVQVHLGFGECGGCTNEVGGCDSHIPPPPPCSFHSRVGLALCPLSDPKL